MTDEKIELNSARGKRGAARSALQDALPDFFRHLGKVQAMRDPEFLPVEGLSPPALPGAVADRFLEAVQTAWQAIDDHTRAQDDLIAALEARVVELEQRDAPHVRKSPEERMREILKARDALRDELGHEPSQRQIGERTGLSQSRVHSLLKEMDDGA